MENITGIPTYVIDRVDQNKRGIISTMSIIATPNSYGRMTIFNPLDEIPDYLNPNEINIFDDRDEWNTVMDLSYDSEGKTAPSLRSTIYNNTTPIPAIILQTEDLDIITSSNYRGIGDLMAIKNVNYSQTNFEVNKFYDTTDKPFSRLFTNHDHPVELINIFNTLWGSLFNKTIIDDYNLHNIKNINDKQFQKMTNKSSISTFALPLKSVLINDLLTPKKINIVDGRWIDTSNDC